MSKVYVVMRGEMHEGGSIISIHESLATANVALTEFVTERFEGQKSQTSKLDDGSLVTVSGCDWVQVLTYDMEP